MRTVTLPTDAIRAIAEHGQGGLVVTGGTLITGDRVLLRADEVCLEVEVGKVRVQNGQEDLCHVRVVEPLLIGPYETGTA